MLKVFIGYLGEKLIVHKNYGGMGFKDLTSFNFAMLGKQGWKFQTNTDYLVTKLGTIFFSL